MKSIAKVITQRHISQIPRFTNSPVLYWPDYSIHSKPVGTLIWNSQRQGTFVGSIRDTFGLSKGRKIVKS
jgi:hypothetical protein